MKKQSNCAIGTTLFQPLGEPNTIQSYKNSYMPNPYHQQDAFVVLEPKSARVLSTEVELTKKLKGILAQRQENFKPRELQKFTVHSVPGLHLLETSCVS